MLREQRMSQKPEMGAQAPLLLYGLWPRSCLAVLISRFVLVPYGVMVLLVQGLRG